MLIFSGNLICQISYETLTLLLTKKIDTSIWNVIYIFLDIFGKIFLLQVTNVDILNDM